MQPKREFDKMPEPETGRSIDVLGIKGLSESIRVATQGFVDGAAAFLSRVCLPAAEEFGLALRDRVSAWRARNAARVLSRANEIHVAQGLPPGEVNPRLIHLAIEEASWIDDADIQGMWAGLLASSVSAPSESDENLIFMNLLKQLSALQVRVLNYGVAEAKKYSSTFGLPMCYSLEVPSDRLSEVTGTVDIQRLDRELDHLRAVGLIGPYPSGGGIDLQTGKADLTPTPLALHLYVRAQGSRLSPTEFWALGPDSGGDEPAA